MSCLGDVAECVGFPCRRRLRAPPCRFRCGPAPSGGPSRLQSCCPSQSSDGRCASSPAITALCHSSNLPNTSSSLTTNSCHVHRFLLIICPRQALVWEKPMSSLRCATARSLANHTSDLPEQKVEHIYEASMCCCCQALDEIQAGIFDGWTYEEIAEKQPEEYAARKRDKLRYRWFPPSTRPRYCSPALQRVAAHPSQRPIRLCSFGLQPGPQSLAEG